MNPVTPFSPPPRQREPTVSLTAEYKLSEARPTFHVNTAIYSYLVDMAPEAIRFAKGKLENGNQADSVFASGGGTYLALLNARTYTENRNLPLPDLVMLTVEHGGSGACWEHAGATALYCAAAMQEDRFAAAPVFNVVTPFDQTQRRHEFTLIGDRRKPGPVVVVDAWVKHATPSLLSECSFPIDETTLAIAPGMNPDFVEQVDAIRKMQPSISHAQLFEQSGTGPDEVLRKVALNRDLLLWNINFSSKSPGAIYRSSSGESHSFDAIPRGAYELTVRQAKNAAEAGFPDKFAWALSSPSPKSKFEVEITKYMADAGPDRQQIAAAFESLMTRRGAQALDLSEYNPVCCSYIPPDLYQTAYAAAAARGITLAEIKFPKGMTRVHASIANLLSVERVSIPEFSGVDAGLSGFAKEGDVLIRNLRK